MEAVDTCQSVLDIGGVIRQRIKQINATSALGSYSRNAELCIISNPFSTLVIHKFTAMSSLGARSIHIEGSLLMAGPELGSHHQLRSAFRHQLLNPELPQQQPPLSFDQH